jgi:RimJ/RimL family protein N-acetyltransferase
MTTFTTKRLAATRLSAADLDTLCAMHRDARVMATLGGVRSPVRTRAFLGHNLRHWSRHGFGLWMFRDLNGGRFVGRGGLRHVAIQGWPEVKISYALMAEFWRQGLATEMATTLVELGDRLGIRNLVASTLPDNHGSRRVMSRVGFRYERDILYTGVRHVLYRRSGARRDGGLGGRPEPPNCK